VAAIIRLSLPNSRCKTSPVRNTSRSRADLHKAFGSGDRPATRVFRHRSSVQCTHRNPAGIAAAVPQSIRQLTRAPLLRQRQLLPQRTSPLPPRERASSNRKPANREGPDHDRTPQQSGPLAICSETILRHFAHSSVRPRFITLHCATPRRSTRWGLHSVHPPFRFLHVPRRDNRSQLALMGAIQPRVQQVEPRPFLVRARQRQQFGFSV
jgi:hypothetical protein